MTTAFASVLNCPAITTQSFSGLGLPRFRSTVGSNEKKHLKLLCRDFLFFRGTRMTCTFLLKTSLAIWPVDKQKLALSNEY